MSCAPCFSPASPLSPLSPRSPSPPPAPNRWISITHGGGNVNVAKGALSEADQSATTLGGFAGRPWHGHHQRRQQPQHRFGPLSYAGQDTTTVGGTALGRGLAITNGGHNYNLAKGFGSTATQSTADPRRHRLRPRQVDHQRRLQLQPGGGRVLLGRPAGRHRRRHGGDVWPEPVERRNKQERGLGFGSSAYQQVFTGGQ